MRTAVAIIGLVFIVGSLVGGDFKSLTDWSSAEKIGYNFGSLFLPLAGAAMVYYGMKKNSRTQ